MTGIDKLMARAEKAEAEVQRLRTEGIRLRELLWHQVQRRNNCHLMPCAAPRNDSCGCAKMYAAALKEKDK